MVVDVASRKFSFGIAPGCCGTFSVRNMKGEDEPYLQNMCDEASNLATVSEIWPSGVSSGSIVAEFPALLSSELGTVKCTAYQLELSDTTPVCSSP